MEYLENTLPKLDDIKKRLEARRDELMSEMRDIDNRLREPETRDDEDRATEREEDEVLEGLGSSAADELREVEGALERISLGTYGVCTTCGSDIGAARLEAVPHAAQCIDCA